MNLKIYQVDAFTDTRYHGNPAAVCILNAPIPDLLMQQIAAEMNLGMTAFLNLEYTRYNLRWFTPVTEVSLCGHATVASAHILWETGTALSSEELDFATRGGRITATCNDTWSQVDFPSSAPSPVDFSDELLCDLGLSREDVAYTGKSTYDFIVQLNESARLRTVEPVTAALLKYECRGFILTSPSDSPDFDFLSRFFAPSIGLPEDHVTGSSHCCLGPYWRNLTSKTTMTGYQASKRGGTILVTPSADGSRVTIGGQSVTTAVFEMRL